MRLSAFILSVLFSFTFCLTAQIAYRGKVLLDSDNTPIESALVFLQSADSISVGYDYTLPDGTFTISIPKDVAKPHTIKVSSLGYSSIQMTWEEFRHSGNIARLSPSSFQLREIKVSAERIREQADTMVYSVAGFSAPDDKTIGDVLARMPGIEVQSDGQIFYQGKAINKFYIEGLDLLNDKYTLASQNLDRKKVKEVEVLRNHQPIAMLRDKQFSEQAALNLVLEDDAKGAWSGSADIGLGASEHELTYRNRLMAMFFGRTMQNLSLYKNDNTGADLMKEVRSHTLGDHLSQTAQKASIIQTATTSLPGIDQERYLFNDAHLLALNHLNRTGPSKTLRTQISYLNEQTETSNEVQTRYTLSDGSQTEIAECNELNNRHQTLDLGINYEANTTQHFLRNRFKGNVAWTASDNKGLLSASAHQAEVRLRRRYIQNTFEYKKSFENKRAASILSSNSYNDNPERLLAINRKIERLSFRSFNSYSEAWYQHKIAQIQARYIASLLVENQQIASHLSDGDIRSNNIPHQRLTRFEPSLGLQLVYKKNIFNAQGDFAIKHWHGFYPEVKFQTGVELTKRSKLTLDYQLTSYIPQLRDTYSGQLYTSYRTIVHNDFRHEANQNQSLTAIYEYSNPLRGWFVMIYGGGLLSHSDYLLDTDIDPVSSIYLLRKVGADYNDKIAFGRIRLGKTWSAWKSTLSANAYFRKAETRQILKGETATYQYDVHSADIHYSSRPLLWLASALSVRWTQNHVGGWASTTYNRIQYALNLTFPIHPKLKLKVGDTVYQQVEQKTQANFLNFNATYSLKKWEFELSAENLTNTRTFYQESLNSQYHSISLFRLRPRECRIRASFNF